MIITRRLAGRLRSVFRQALSLPTRGTMPKIELVAGPSGLRIRCGLGQAAAEFRLDGEQPEETAYIPFELLRDVEGRRETPVAIHEHDGRVTATWHDGSIPQMTQHASPVVVAKDWPSRPERLDENPPRLIRALAEACATTDPDSLRYALGCVLLCGDPERIVATDGRQLLIEEGFSFPWDGELLLPASKVFGNKRLCIDDDPVRVGRTDQWLTLGVGPWTFWWQPEREGRFPDVTRQIGRPELSIASFEMPAADRAFLADNLPRLPGDGMLGDPVTVDLNGSVAIRARAADQPTATELILSHATRRGEPVRINTSRRYLNRAVRLGFDRIHVFSPRSPVLACDGSRTYVWALLDADSALKPSEDAVRIESAKTQAPSPVRRPRPRTKRRTSSTMPTKSDKPTRAGDNGHAKSTNHDPNDTPTDAIQQATALRASLREAVAQTTELIRTLKAERRQNKQLRGALASLRRLRDEMPDLAGTG